MLHNNKIKKLFFPMLVLPLLGGCIHPRPLKTPFDSAEVAWAKTPGTASVKGCVSGVKYTKWRYPLWWGPDRPTVDDMVPVKSSLKKEPQDEYTVDFLPESTYTNLLAKKMHKYGFHYLGFKNLNDPRWVSSSILSYIPHFSCPDAGPGICTSVGHFVFSDLPVGNWYVVVDYHTNDLKPGHAIVVKKLTTVAGEVVPLVSWFGPRQAEPCTP